MTHFTHAFISAAAMVQDIPKLADGLAGYGAVGICLVALATWYILKDRRYEKRIDERLTREAEFQREYAALAEKYRTAMEKVSTALDLSINLLRNVGRGGAP